MAGLDPAIHQKQAAFICTMDCRVKPGNDSGDICDMIDITASL
jgi:hypothetical protein